MTDLWKVIRAVVFLIVTAFGIGAAYGACQVGATLVRRLVE
jgi:hypothetical protein